MSDSEESGCEESGRLALHYGGYQTKFFIKSRFGWGVDGNETNLFRDRWSPKSDGPMTQQNAPFILYFAGPESTRKQFVNHVMLTIEAWKADHPSCFVILC